MSKSGPWKKVVEETLEDSRQQKDPLPLQEFPFLAQAGRYVKLEVVSFYGYGGTAVFLCISRAWIGVIENVLENY